MVTDGEVEKYLDSNRVKIRGCIKGEMLDYLDECEWRQRTMINIIRSLFDEGMQGEEEIKEYEE